MRRTLRLESVNGCPVVEWRIGEDGAIERRALLPDGEIPRDTAGAWAPVDRSEIAHHVGGTMSTGPVGRWLASHGITARTEAARPRRIG